MATGAIQYTSLYELQNDLSLYISIKNQEPYNLAHIPAIARNRWVWIVDKWTSLLKERFKTVANGEQYLETNLLDFDRSVEAYKIGNKTNVLAIPEKFVRYSEFLQTVLLSEIGLSKDETDILNTEITKALNFDITRFREMLRFLKQQSVLTAQYVGLADETSARIREIATAPKKRRANYADMRTMQEGIGLEQFIEGIVIELKRTSKKPPNLLISANQNIAAGSPVSINDAYVSYVSVPFESSLQQMATRYLGSPDRWFELVTVNNLRAPFVDENGTKSFLLSSGSNNTIYVPASLKDVIAISSKIKLGSFKLREEVRVIEKISDNKDGTLTVFLSGTKDLSKFSIADKPYVRVYKPGTVTTGSFVLIPSIVPANNTDAPTPQSDELRRTDRALLAFGVDIQRNEVTNDFIIDPSGNFKLCYGIANVRQSTLTLLRLNQGELPYQPALGVPDTTGEQYFNTVDEAIIVGDLIKEAVKLDARFKNVLVDNFKTGGNSISLNLYAFIEGVETGIPLSFAQ
jgi:hypothetical protein